jgi:hypothetical protein
MNELMISVIDTGWQLVGAVTPPSPVHLVKGVVGNNLVRKTYYVKCVGLTPVFFLNNNSS